jgi:G:T-mismatch repair DNA endonuclease (very short patch repair protein)
MIDKKDWHICKLCNARIKELAKIYGGNGIYYAFVFQQHLKIDHNLELEQYFTDRPICSCGICNELVDVCRGHKTSNFEFKQYKCGRNPGILEWSKNAKETRQGSGNPMYGKETWNKGKTKETDIRMKSIADKRTGLVQSAETKKKQSESAKTRKVHGHTGLKHSEESKQKMRIATLRRIKNGEFTQLKSKPHLTTKKILEELRISFKEEYTVTHWSFDFYLDELDIYLEVDGDYFHSHPKIWPNGPKSKTQKINWSRDIKKNKFCQENNMKLIRIWEYDIVNNIDTIKEQLCHLQKS